MLCEFGMRGTVATLSIGRESPAEGFLDVHREQDPFTPLRLELVLACFGLLKFSGLASSATWPANLR